MFEKSLAGANLLLYKKAEKENNKVVIRNWEGILSAYVEMSDLKSDLVGRVSVIFAESKVKVWFITSIIEVLV